MATLKWEVVVFPRRASWSYEAGRGGLFENIIILYVSSSSIQLTVLKLYFDIWHFVIDKAIVNEGSVFSSSSGPNIFNAPEINQQNAISTQHSPLLAWKITKKDQS